MTPLSVIIVGAPRSGTYWVVDLLQTRFGIPFPSETHFTPIFSRYLWLWGDLSVALNRRRLLKNIYEFLQVWTAYSSSSSDYLSQIRRLSLLVTLDEGCSEEIVAESSDYPSLVEALYRHFAKIHGADTSGDKSAHYRALNPEVTFGLFPEALMLHVVRDGRDVALSWTKQWFGPASNNDAAQLWCEHVEINRAWGSRNPSRYHEIRYEDLATVMESEIRRLESFLGKPALPELDEDRQSELAQALAYEESHSAMGGINASGNISKWRSQMAPGDIAQFEDFAGETLAACGYEVSMAGKAEMRSQFPRISMHLFRVVAKTLLPLVLGLCSRLGFSILSLLNRRYPTEWRKVRMNDL